MSILILQRMYLKLPELRKFTIQGAVLLSNRIGVAENCLNFNQLKIKVDNESNQLKYSLRLTQ